MRHVGPGLVALLLLASCAGYTTQRIEAFPGTRTIAVRPIVNQGFRRDLELRLAQAVTDEIRARTHYALADPAVADLVLEASLTADEELLVQGADRQPIQKLLEGTVTLRILDRSGEVVRNETLTATDEFLIDRYGQSLDGSATDEWARRMAIRIVQSLERGF